MQRRPDRRDTAGPAVFHCLAGANRSCLAVRLAYAEKLLQQYDGNADGLLDRDEAKAIPPLIGSAGMREIQSLSESSNAVDRERADDRTTLAKYID